MKIRKIFFLLIFTSFFFTSCRTGEFLSEADPETEAEVEVDEAEPIEDDL